MKAGSKWTEDQLAFLILHYPSERAIDVAAAIGKSKCAVHHKAHELGLGKDKEGFFNIRSAATSGANCGNFKGYRRKTPKGYIICYRPDHPYASKHGLVMEHRLVVEEMLGHYLSPEYDVHHINGVKDDNRPENLQVMTHAEHSKLHGRRW